MEFAEKKFNLTRDKRGDGNVYNNTENLLYSFFRHYTARPVGGIADPHLHTHCTVFNMTYDEAVGKFNAMEFHDFAKYRNQIEAYHHSTLARKLQELGIGIENTYNSFEVAGFNRELIEKFSNRTRIKENIDIPVKDTQSFNVSSQEKLKLAKGDTITLTLNGKSETETRLLKEARHQIKSIEIDPKTKNPKITLDNDQVLKQDFKYLNYGYATTNYKSQGQTVKNVLISQSEQAYPASGRQSLNVACSRAKETVLIATDNKKARKKSFHLDRSKKIGKDLQIHSQSQNKVKNIGSMSRGFGK
jgi:ATP-dependent exoDNAse (exonuclease V) alpha subunit